MLTSFMKKICRVLPGLFFLGAALKILLAGFDIDEQYAIAMSYRLIKGDFPLLTMWEPHQTSGFLGALLMLPWLAVFQTTTGIVLYLRLMGLLLHSLVTFFLYKQLKTTLPKNTCLLICCIWFFSLPKLMFLPEFSNMQLWFLMLSILCLLKYYTRPCNDVKAFFPHLGFLWAAGFFLAMEVLSYPSTVLAFPVCVFFIFYYKNSTGRSLTAELTAFTAPCVLSAACFAGILLSRMSLKQLLTLLPLAASDGSHSASLSEKLAVNLSSLGEILFYFGIYSLISVILYLAYRLAGRLLPDCKWLRGRIPFAKCYPSLLLFCTLAGQLFIWIFADRYPNYPLAEYFFLPFMGIFRLRKAKQTPHLSFFVIMPLAAFAGIILFTNHPLLVSSPFLIPCVTGVLSLPGFLEIKSPKATSSGFSEPAPPQTACKAAPQAVLSGGVLILWAAVLLFGKLYMVRTTGGVHYTIFDRLGIMREGPAAGIIADRETVRRYNISYDFLQENLPRDAKVFYAGVSSVVYLMQDMEICTPSTISSPTFDGKIDLYFSMNPQKLPQYVVCDADLPDLYGSTWLTDFLRENCEPEPFTADDFLLVYRMLPANAM